jgi:hypothetical protein
MFKRSSIKMTESIRVEMKIYLIYPHTGKEATEINKIV